MSSEPEFASIRSINPSIGRQGFGMVTHGADNALWVEFHEHPVHSPFKSEQANRPIYETKVYCRITIPSSSGTVKQINDELANEEHKRRFPQQWEAFQQGKKVTEIGTPIEMWPQIDQAMAASCKHLGIFSVEQLAALNDSQAANLGPLGRKMVETAKVFIDTASESAKSQALAAENSDMRAQLVELQKQVTAMAAAQSSAPQSQQPAQPEQRKRA